MTRLTRAVVAAGLALALAAAPVQAVPSIDNWAAAQLLTGSSGGIAGTTSGATLETNENPYFSGANFYPSVWFKWSPGRKTLLATFDTCNTYTTWDTVLQVYTGMAAPPDWGPYVGVASNDDADACLYGQSLVTFTAFANETYWIRLSGYGGSTGEYILGWTTQAAERASLKVVLTANHQDPTTCILTVKGSNLLPDQDIQFHSGTNVEYSKIFTSVAGRWTDTDVVGQADWSQSAGDPTIWIPITLLAGDGQTEVLASITNRCKP